MTETKLPPGTRIKDYELVDGIVATVAAEVHLAKDSQGQQVIVKIAHEEPLFDIEHPDYPLRTRLIARSLEEGVTELYPDPNLIIEKEARVTRIIDDPLYAQVLDEGSWNGRSFLVREFIDGIFWDAMLMNGDLHVHHVVELLEHLANLNDRGHGHGDLKPGHVLYDREGRLRIISPSVGMYGFDDSPLKCSEIFVTPAYRPMNDPGEVQNVGMMLVQVLCRLVFLEPSPLALPLSPKLQNFHALGRTLPDSWEMVTNLPLPSHYDSTCPPELERIALYLLGLEWKDGVLNWHSESLPRCGEAARMLQPFEDYKPARPVPRLTLHPTGLQVGEDSDGQSVAIEFLHEIRVDGRTYWLGERIAPNQLIILEATVDGFSQVTNSAAIDRVSAYVAALVMELEGVDTALQPGEVEAAEEVVDILPDVLRALSARAQG